MLSEAYHALRSVTMLQRCRFIVIFTSLSSATLNCERALNIYLCASKAKLN